MLDLTSKLIIRSLLEAAADMSVDPEEFTTRTVYNIVKNAPTPDLVVSVAKSFDELMGDVVAELEGNAVRNTPAKAQDFAEGKDIPNGYLGNR